MDQFKPQLTTSERMCVWRGRWWRYLYDIFFKMSLFFCNLFTLLGGREGIKLSKALRRVWYLRIKHFLNVKLAWNLWTIWRNKK